MLLKIIMTKVCWARSLVLEIPADQMRRTDHCRVRLEKERLLSGAGAKFAFPILFSLNPFSSPVSFCVVAGLFFMNSSFSWKKPHLLAAAPRGRPPLTLPTTISFVVSKFSNFQIWTDYFQIFFSFFFGSGNPLQGLWIWNRPLPYRDFTFDSWPSQMTPKPHWSVSVNSVNNGFFILDLIVRSFFYISVIFCFIVVVVWGVCRGSVPPIYWFLVPMINHLLTPKKFPLSAWQIDDSLPSLKSIGWPGLICFAFAVLRYFCFRKCLL